MFTLKQRPASSILPVEPTLSFKEIQLNDGIYIPSESNDSRLIVINNDFGEKRVLFYNTDNGRLSFPGKSHSWDKRRFTRSKEQILMELI